MLYLEAEVAGNSGIMLFLTTMSCVFVHVCISVCYNKDMCYMHVSFSGSITVTIFFPLLAVRSTNEAHMLHTSLMSHYHRGFQALLLQFKALAIEILA